MDTITDTDAVKAVALRSFELMRDGTPAEFEALIAPDALNYEQKDEPPASRGGGPRSFHATAEWLREAFAELDWEIHTVVVEDDLVAVHCTMTGRHVRTFVTFDQDARVADAFPATGKRFAVTQSHWLRVRGGVLVEHWANRDDLGMGRQLGWNPPSPVYLVRMLLATRHAR